MIHPNLLLLYLLLYRVLINLGFFPGILNILKRFITSFTMVTTPVHDITTSGKGV